MTKHTPKTYVLDTNVLINSANSIYSFSDNEVVLADVTLEELDNLKSRPGELGYQAREANRVIFELREKAQPGESIRSGIKLSSGGIFRVETNYTAVELPAGWEKDKADHRILRIAKGMSEEGKTVTLITNDIAMLLKAEILGIHAKKYDLTQIIPIENHSGRKEIGCLGKHIDTFCSNKGIDANIFEEENPFCENEYVTLVDVENRSHSALGRYETGMIVPLINASPYEAKPRNAGQRFAIDAMLQPVDKIPLVILKGAAGTAKTFLSLACGLECVLEENLYNKILVTRANVKFDDDIGFLKGTEVEKIMPLMRPVIDNLELLHRDRADKKDIINEFFQREIIVTEALAYIRGRSIARTWILIDEAQNLTPNQALGIITRAGVGSKIILAGDVDQIDNPRLDSHNNGLTFTASVMSNNRLCAQINFLPSECERSALSMEAANKMKL